MNVDTPLPHTLLYFYKMEIFNTLPQPASEFQNVFQRYTIDYYCCTQNNTIKNDNIVINNIISSKFM